MVTPDNNFCTRASTPLSLWWLTAWGPSILKKRFLRLKGHTSSDRLCCQGIFKSKATKHSVSAFAAKVFYSQKHSHSGKLSPLVEGEGLAGDILSSNKPILLLCLQYCQMRKAYLLYVNKAVYLTGSPYTQFAELAGCMIALVNCMVAITCNS